MIEASPRRNEVKIARTRELGRCGFTVEKTFWQLALRNPTVDIALRKSLYSKRGVGCIGAHSRAEG
jgi:hypothetical protein